MNRRDLLKQITLLTGAVVVGGDFFLSGCKRAVTAEVGFTPANISLLDEIGETIIPATATPGSKAAKIGEFMKVIVTDCYTERQQAVFAQGLDSLEETCNKMYDKNFMECDEVQRKDLLLSLEKEAKVFNKKRDEEDKPKKEAHKQKNEQLPWKDQTEFEGTPSHYYTMMKQLTLWGFFTSETGMTETLRHVPVPGSYDGAVPYTEGEKAWAE
jgi:hypothetical protein